MRLIDAGNDRHSVLTALTFALRLLALAEVFGGTLKLRLVADVRPIDLLFIDFWN